MVHGGLGITRVGRGILADLRVVTLVEFKGGEESSRVRERTVFQCCGGEDNPTRHLGGEKKKVVVYCLNQPNYLHAKGGTNERKGNGRA